MDMIGLKYFVSAAQWLNFTKAADECCITQTAMSLHIAKIEKELGFRLFDRDKRSVSLTPGGRAFYAEALTVLRRYGEGVKRSAAIASGFEGVLTIGYTNYLECSALPEAIRNFKAQYPGIDVLLTKNEPNEAIDGLERGMNDLTVAFPYDLQDRQEIAATRIASHRIGVVLRRDHPLAGKERVSLCECANETVIVGGQGGAPRLYRQVREDWQRLSFAPREILEADSADSILFLVEAGYGVALMPSYTRRLLSERIAMIRLEEDSLSVDISLAHRKKNQNPSLALFLAFLGDHAESLGEASEGMRRDV